MGIGEKEDWPLQRLILMLNQLQVKEKDTWKQVPISNTQAANEIGPKERDDAVAWIAELTQLFSFQPETFFLASSILDRFITAVKAQPKYLKCIAISCFYLASKICEEENVVPCTGDLVKDSKCGCRPCDVLQMERIILVKLSWSVQNPTAIDYLHIFHTMSFIHFTDLTSKLSFSRHLGFLTKLLVKAVCCYKVACFPNAAISLALVSLHLKSILPDPEKWTCISGRLQSLSKVKTQDFMLCRELLMSFMPPEVASLRKRKPATIKKIANLENIRIVKEAITGGSVAIKRKASKPSPTIADEWSKKPHSNPRFDFSDAMDVADCDDIDSDATMTASESEDDGEVATGDAAKNKTYADIVKCGLDDTSEMCVEDLSSEDPVSDAYARSLRALQVSCAFLSTTVPPHNPVSDVWT